MTRKLLFLPLAFVFFAGAALACVEYPERVLSASEIASLRQHIESLNLIVDSNTKIRSSRAWGYERFSQVILSFEPHETVEGVDVFYQLRCSKGVTKTKCRDMEIRKSISVEEQTSYVEIDDAVDAETAIRIVQFVHAEIIVDENGRFKASIYEEPAILDGPLIISSIAKTHDGYRLYVKNDELCTNHRIEVTVAACDKSGCEIEIVSNEIFYAS